MTKEALQFNLEKRRDKMGQFLAAPENYKVCEQCSSIVFIRSRVCQVCACYRFDHSREAVIRVSKIIGSSPFPFTAGVVPRYGE